MLKATKKSKDAAANSLLGIFCDDHLIKYAYVNHQHSHLTNPRGASTEKSKKKNTSTTTYTVCQAAAEDQ